MDIIAIVVGSTTTGRGVLRFVGEEMYGLKRRRCCCISKGRMDNCVPPAFHSALLPAVAFCRNALAWRAAPSLQVERPLPPDVAGVGAETGPLGFQSFIRKSTVEVVLLLVLRYVFWILCLSGRP
jgi:hypothetical protein